MSYILDALRRAEAERERGNVPGLHTQPVAAPTAPVAPASLRPALLWAGVLALVLLVGALAWLLLARPAAPEPATLAVSPRIAPTPAPPLPAAPMAIAPSEAMKVVPVAPVQPPRSTAVSEPASAASPPPAIVPWDRLPESQRRQLPALAIGGAIWSESAANRMLIVSGQLLHEGDAAAPGVVLEQIRQKSAVLRWKDLRYEVSF
jgi:general secretion pathway protein B